MNSTNRKVCITVGLGLSLLTAVIYRPVANSLPEMRTITYQADQNANFANPERGFYAAFDPLGNEPAPALTVDELKSLREKNITLARRIYLIADFRHKHLSQKFLDKVATDLETARQAGIKLILRFSYNWENGGDDASQERIISHWSQLQPVLQDNYDAIAYVEAGFIGYWGEWNRSSHGLHHKPQARKDILLKALSVVPSERMVAMRYPHHKRSALGNNHHLTPREAWQNTPRARTGFYNDCLLYGEDQGGTFSTTEPRELAKQKKWLSQENLYVVQGGEFCQPTPEVLDCPTVVKELRSRHWSTLNILKSYDPLQEIYKQWKAQGCFQQVSLQLGYRFRALKLAVPKEKLFPGDSLEMKLTITNDGWSSPYNPRDVELVLRHSKTKAEYHFPLQEDPRTWLPGQQQVINLTSKIKLNMPTGEYQVFLNLPDSSPRLRDRPEYSIRLANQDVWEESTGYNSLLTSIIVESKPDLGSNQ
ncbi:MAG: DUF4832 domain-containing protein [Xenococcaceae cyanobacterium MO_188.B29]|nr:DUF4832 domain-containing protein [Xenococcaceae cyanobacterium MO_188.B29]